MKGPNGLTKQTLYSSWDLDAYVDIALPETVQKYTVYAMRRDN